MRLRDRWARWFHLRLVPSLRRRFRVAVPNAGTCDASEATVKGCRCHCLGCKYNCGAHDAYGPTW